MAIKRPFCNYDGELKELAATDSLSSTPAFPYWKINAGEIVSIGDRQEYLIANGILANYGTISLGVESILIVRA